MLPAALVAAAVGAPTEHPAEAFAQQALSYAQGAGAPEKSSFLKQALAFAHQTWPERTAEAHTAVGAPLPSVPKHTHVWTASGSRSAPPAHQTHALRPATSGVC